MTDEEIRDCVKDAVARELKGQLPEELGEVLSPVIRSAVRDYVKLDAVRKMVKEINAPFKKAIFFGLFCLAVASGIAIKGNSDQTKNIQDSRRTSIKEQCKDQNSRHDHVITALDVALAPRLKQGNPKQDAAILQRRVSTILLIDALAPKQDCDQVVKERVEPK